MRLLEPIKVGKIELKNRVMFPPMTTGYEGRDGTIVEQSFNFYKRLAEGGVSYIVLGDVAPVNTISPTPKLFHDGQIEAFRKLADAVHEFDCKLGIQIFHPEYDVEALAELFRKGDMEGGRAKMRHDMVHFIQEVTEEQLNSILDKIGECVKRAQSAGVDIIEVHGDRLMINEAVEFAKILERSGVDMIHVGQANHTGNMNDTIPAMGTQPYCFMSKYTKQIKEAVSIPVSSVGRIVTPENAEALIENGVCDIVGLGRSLLADPDYVKKLEAGEGRRIRHCMMCNKGCTDAIQNRKFLSCVLNAENGYEYERTITPSDEKKKVVVIGGGVAGMEAARVASVKGHEVVLFEKETTLGGQLNIASIPPRKSEMNRALRYLTNEMKELHVDLRLGRTADAEMILAENPDNVIVAAGAHNVIPPIEGSKMPHVFDAWKVLNHEELPSGRVVVIGGGLVGAETAELLAEMGCQVSVVEMMEEIAKEESKTVRPVLFESFEKYQVQLLTGTKVTAITANSVEAENAEGKVSLPCDYVVLAVGARPNLFDAQALEDKGVQVSFVGDCNERAADINRAVEEGYLAANVL